MRGSYLIRAIDRYIGIPILFFLGLFKRERQVPELPPSKIAVLLSAAIGDSVLGMAVISDLKKKFPKASITVFCGGSNKEFLKRYDFISLVVLKIFNPFLSILKIIQSGKFDIWIDTGQWQRISALYSFFARAKWKVGFNTPKQCRHFIFDQSVGHMKTVHELDNFRNLIRGFGIHEFSTPFIETNIKPEKDRIVVHAFAGGSKPHLKEWPIEYWVELINALLERGKSIVLTGVKTDEFWANVIAKKTNKPFAVHVVAGKLNLNETIDELAKAETVISVNTGIMHIAAALGVHTIGIHGPTSVLRWGPIGKDVRGIQSTRGCSPCLNLGFDYGCPKNDCMKEISPKEIVKLV